MSTDPRIVTDSKGNQYRIISHWTRLIVSVPGRRGNHSDLFVEIDHLNGNRRLSLQRLGLTNTYRIVNCSTNHQMFAEMTKIRCPQPQENRGLIGGVVV